MLVFFGDLPEAELETSNSRGTIEVNVSNMPREEQEVRFDHCSRFFFLLSFLFYLVPEWMVCILGYSTYLDDEKRENRLLEDESGVTNFGLGRFEGQWDLLGLDVRIGRYQSGHLTEHNSAMAK